MQKRALAGSNQTPDDEAEESRQHVVALNQKGSLDDATMNKCPT
jgi:hypothetical protein